MERRHLLIDDVLDGIRYLAKAWDGEHPPEKNDDFMALARRAVVFDCHEVEDYFWAVNALRDSEWSVRDFPCVRLPFPVCWFETQAFRDGTRVGCLLVERRLVGTAGAEVGPALASSDTIVDARWFTRLGDEAAALIAIAQFRIYADGSLKEWAGETCISPADRDEAEWLYVPVLTALGMLHCTNREVAEVAAPEPLQLRRKKRGRVPLVTYTRIDVPGWAAHSQRLQAAASSGRRLHFVRGHFRRVTSDRPLRWIEQYLRGEYLRGVALARYRVKPHGHASAVKRR